jgi:ribosomal protein S18 acetylase RimI-like enzyme
MPANTELLIRPVGAQSVPDAVRLVFGDLARAERHLEVQSLVVGQLPVEGVLEARRGDRLVGAILSIRQPGKTGLIWPPRLVDDEPADTADQLVQAAHEVLESDELSMVYTAMDTVSRADERLLYSHGYEQVSHVLYLASAERDFPAARPEGVLDFEPCCNANHDRLVRMIEASYEETLDCPRLAGVRRVEDVLDGYRQAGDPSLQHWLLARHGGKDVGCLLLADHPDHGSCELVYMGLAIHARGHGWGKQLARHAQWLTARSERPRLVVAVDTANDPAMAIYTSVGFHAWDRRTVYVRVF